MFDRVSNQRRVRSTKTQVWPAPVKGWLASGNLSASPLDGAEVLDNCFPTAQGARLRYGSSKHATVDDTPVRFLTYQSGANATLFASTDTALYDVTSPADAAVVPTPVISGLSSGDWSSVQFTTSGGAYVVAVNGSDHAVYFDGTNAQPLVDEEVFDLAYDALTGSFTVGQTITGGTSGATAELLAVAPSSATAGTLKLGAITGTFQDNEALTDPVTGAATSNIPSGTSSASAITVTGSITTAQFSHTWMFKQRILFVEKNSLNVWYLPVDSIGGAANKLSLGSVFKKGGNIIFGATWSLDSGSGLDDKCVMATDQGEVAIYSGTNPASDFSIVGVYQIGEPVDKHAAVQIGGELVIVTNDGLMPISQAISKDRTALIASALSAPIEDAWQAAMGSRSTAFPVTATLWQSSGMMIVGVPITIDGKGVAYVVNAKTGAWCRYIGWDVRCSDVFNDGLYFGSEGGVIYRGETGGNDNGTAYTATYVPRFSDCGVSSIKLANHVNLIARASAEFSFSATVFSNYNITSITAAAPLPEPSGAMVWGSFTWGSFVWGGLQAKLAQSEWKSAAATGFSLAPGFSVTSNQTAAPYFEITASKVRYEIGLPV